MKLELLLQWNYLLFLVPFALSALMLVLSSFRIGHHSGGGARHHAPATSHGHAHSHGASGHGAKVQGSTTHAQTHTHNSHATKHGTARNTSKAGHAEAPPNYLMMLTALRRAPLMMKLQTFFIGWGLGGFWAHYILLRDPNPTLPKLLPILVIAVGCGLASAFLLALVFAVFMPQEESFDVSRDSLYGMTGKIIFAVDEMQGRIRIYDVHGTIHDEPCIIAPNHAPIPKGANAIVLDKDSKGRLIVEQVS